MRKWKQGDDFVPNDWGGGGGTNREFVVEDKLSLNTSKVKIEEEPAINEP